MLSNEKWFGASAGFYPFEIGQSLRLDGDARLSHSHQSAPTLQTKATVSFWIKLHDNDDRNIVLHTGVGVGNNTHMTLQFGGGTSNDGIKVGQYGRNLYVNPSSGGVVQRDFANFYHFQMSFDSTSSTASERVVKLYINGEQITVGTFTQMGQGDLFPFTAQSNAIYIGGHTPGYNYFTSGNIAEFIIIDGQALDNTYFGETKNGVWIPKEYSGTYGNNGFRLTFEGSGTATTTDGTTAQTNIGDDQSGNGNNFAVYSSSVGTHDVLLDSPTNNFATYNVLTGHSSTTMSQGNLRALANNSSNILESQSSTIGVTSGKWYAEFRADDLVNDTQNNGTQIGVTTVPFNRGSGNQNGYVVGNTRVNLDQNTGAYLGVDQDLTQNNIGTYSDGDIIGVALNVDDSQVSFYKNGSAITNAQNASITVVNDLHFFEIQVRKYDGDTSQITANFGQDSTFAGATSAGGNTDGNGVGDFKYSVPSGYLALCSSNLPDTTISPNQSTQADDHFNTVTYSGTGSSNAITGVGFQPDWSWFKERSSNTGGGDYHFLVDSSRGSTAVLQSNTTGAESTGDSLSFDSDGFTLGTYGGGNANQSGETYVAWNWKAGGSTPTKTYKVKVVADSTDYGHGSGANKYQFFKSDGTTGFGTNGVDIDLQEGGTYVFDWSDSSAQGHPLRFSLTNNGTHGGGSEYTTGVVKDDSAYKTTITVASGVANLYYYCQLHSGMGAEVRTNTTHGSTNFDGSVLSVSQTNETAGFSIVKYIGSSGAKDVGHGLTKAPELLFVKDRDATSNWWTGTTVVDGSMDFLYLNSTNAGGNSSISVPTSTTFNVDGTDLNTTGNNKVAFCFHSVEGYSKIGSYTGNGSATDGTYVFCGFSVSWVMVKRTNSTGSWTIYDNKRNTFNARSKRLVPNLSNAEADTSTQAVDFLSNGFKLKSNNTDQNGSGDTYIYMAFADGRNFKFGNAL